MKNILILIVFAAVFLHFYPQPEVTEWYEEQKETVLTMFSEATDTKVRLKSSKIYDDLKPYFDTFRESEIKHVKEITSSRSSVKNYFTDYCSGKRDSKLHINNQKQVCKVISQYTGLF